MSIPSAPPTARSGAPLHIEEDEGYQVVPDKAGICIDAAVSKAHHGPGPWVRVSLLRVSNLGNAEDAIRIGTLTLTETSPGKPERTTVYRLVADNAELGEIDFDLRLAALRYLAAALGDHLDLSRTEVSMQEYRAKPRGNS